MMYNVVFFVAIRKEENSVLVLFKIKGLFEFYLNIFTEFSDKKIHNHCKIFFELGHRNSAQQTNWIPRFTPLQKKDSTLSLMPKDSFKFVTSCERDQDVSTALARHR